MASTFIEMHRKDQKWLQIRTFSIIYTQQNNRNDGIVERLTKYMRHEQIHTIQSVSEQAN